MAATPMASDVSSTQPKGLGLLSPSAGTYLALQGEGQTDTLTESLIVQGAGAFLALPAPPGALVERVGRVSRLLASCGTTTLSPVDEGNIFANLHERIDWEYLSSLQIDTEYTVDDLLVVSTDVGKFIEDGGRALENFAVLAENDEKYASKYTESTHDEGLRPLETLTKFFSPKDTLCLKVWVDACSTYRAKDTGRCKIAEMAFHRVFGQILPECGKLYVRANEKAITRCSKSSQGTTTCVGFRCGRHGHCGAVSIAAGRLLEEARRPHAKLEVCIACNGSSPVDRDNISSCVGCGGIVHVECVSVQLEKLGLSDAGLEKVQLSSYTPVCSDCIYMGAVPLMLNVIQYSDLAKGKYGLSRYLLAPFSLSAELDSVRASWREEKRSAVVAGQELTFGGLRAISSGTTGTARPKPLVPGTVARARRGDPEHLPKFGFGKGANASPTGEEEKLKALVKEGTSKLRFDLEAAATAMEEASGLQTPTAEQIAVRTARLTSLMKDLNPGTESGRSAPEPKWEPSSRSGTRRGYANWVRLVSAYRLQESESRLMAALHEYRFHQEQENSAERERAVAATARRNQLLEFKGKLAQARAEAPPGNSSAPPNWAPTPLQEAPPAAPNGNGEETAVVERLMKVVAELKEQVSDMRQAQKTGTYLPPISTRGVDFLAKKAPDGNVAESPFHIGDVSFFEKFPYLGTSRAGGWTLWQEYMLHDKAPFTDADLRLWRNGQVPLKRKHKSLQDPVENWTSFRHAQGHVDADLFNLWCDNVYRHVYDIWIDATTGTGEGIYARNCAHRERNLQMLRMLMSRMAILKLTALYWTREVSLEERWSAGVLLIMLSKRAADWTSSSRQFGEEDQAWWEHLRLADKPTLPSDVSGANGVFVLQHTSAYHVLQARLASGETMQQVSAPFSVYRPMAVSDVASASAVAGKPPPPEGEVAQFDATIHCQHCYRYSRSLINLHPGRTHLEAQLTFAKKLHNRLTFLNKKANDGGDKDDADKDATSEKAAAGGPGK